MQLTSTSEEDRSLRQRPPSLWSRLNHPLVPGIIAFLGWLGFALARWQIWAKGHLSLFIMAGHVYTHRAQLPRGLLLVPSEGYDGQFYYRLAMDPANWHATAFGITMDQSYRYTRIGYPILAWIFSLGQHQLVPVVLVVLNLFAVAAMAVLGGMFARDIRSARPVGARLRRLLRPGHQRGPGHRGTGGRGVHAGRPARLPAGRHPDVPAGRRAVRLRRDHQGNHLVRPGRDRRHPADRDRPAPGQSGPGRPDLARTGRRVRGDRTRGAFRGQGRVPVAGEQQPEPHRAVHRARPRAEVQRRAPVTPRT